MCRSIVLVSLMDSQNVALFHFISASIIRPAVSCIPLSTSPHLSCSLLALPVRGSVCGRYHRCVRRGQKTTLAAKREPAASWSVCCYKGRKHLTLTTGAQNSICSEDGRVSFFSTSPCHTHTNTHSRLLGKQGWQALQWRRNACPVWAYTLSRAPNCSDKYEMVEIRDKGS